MRTHHVAFYLALAVGVVAAVGLATGTGLWLNLHRPLGSEGILVFLGAATVIILLVEVIAGYFGPPAPQFPHRGIAEQSSLVREMRVSNADCPASDQCEADERVLCS